MLNRSTFGAALVVALLFLGLNEWYWGVQAHWPRGHDLESLDVWADQRALVPDLSQEDVIILGSSRAHFNLNIHRWDSITGRRPLQLAYPGSSPLLYPIILNTLTERSAFLSFGLAGIFHFPLGSAIICTSHWAETAVERPAPIPT